MTKIRNEREDNVTEMTEIKSFIIRCCGLYVDQCINLGEMDKFLER